LKIKHKPESDRTFDDIHALYYYEVWIANAIKRLKRAREVGKKMRACVLIQHKWIEFMYRPNGLIVKQLAQYFKLLWTIREEMRQQQSRMFLFE
jgi:hypothetical protein